MQLGWIDFSKEERNKVLNVIHLLDEPGAVDEIGIGAIRDAFAEYFFPGTSTIQTRAKYFLIVPYILKEAGSGMYGNEANAIIKKIDNEERLCRDILIRTSTEGVIGGTVPDAWVLRTPSEIYWPALKKLGIFKFSDLSVKEYIRQSIIQRTLKKTKEGGNRDKEAKENEKDDNDAGDITAFNFWNLQEIYQKDWRDNLTIELLPKEADYLKRQIITSYKDSLFAYILKNNISLDKYETFGALSKELGDSVGPELEYMMNLANDFNNMVALLTTRYNLIVSQGENETAKEKWDILSKDIVLRSSVDLNAIFEKLHIRSRSLQKFLIAEQRALKDGDIDTVDDLIIKREVELKDISRAKTKRAGEYPTQRWIGAYMLDYRYNPAKRIIDDIMNAEVKGNV